MSLYLKYRPKSFDTVVGQRHIIDILLAQAAKKEFSNSYLLYGPRGTGKTTTARLLAKVVNCTTFDENGYPDFVHDPQAQLIDDGKTLDFVEIDAASHTGVDNIREEIIDKALYPPSALKMKVYVIDEVHMLSKGAFNALLKIMEEPRDYLMFVLATTEIHKVPDTIRSRCQVFNFKHLRPDEISGRLEEIAGKEGIEYEKEGLQLIAKLSQGAMRDAIKYLEQVSILGKITQDNVAKFLGVVSDNVIADFLKAVEEKNFDIVSVSLDRFVEQGTDFGNLVKDILMYLDDHFLENPSLYSALAGMFQEISSEAKRYPQPVLLRKRKIWNRISGEAPSPKTSTSSAAPMPVVESKPTHAEKRSVSLEKDEQKEITSSEKTPDSTQNPQEESMVSESGGDSSVTGGESADVEGLMEKIIERVDKMMLKSVLKKQAIISGLHDGVLRIVVINEQFYNTVQKPETVGYMENIVSDILGVQTVVQRIYKSKEDFMKEQLSS